MPTPSEQKALAFVAAVLLLGGAVRVLRAGSPTGPTEIEQQALARQATAADSATSAAKAGKGKRARKASSKRDTLPVIVGGVASVPSTFARPDRPNARAQYGSPLGFPPPSPRIDTYAPSSPAPATPAPAPAARKGVVAGVSIDVDKASVAEIEKLPGIGPAFARRIIANRDSMGAFGSLEALRRVKGIGPAMLQKLSPYVTFSGSTPARR